MEYETPALSQDLTRQRQPWPPVLVSTLLPALAFLLDTHWPAFLAYTPCPSFPVPSPHCVQYVFHVVVSSGLAFLNCSGFKPSGWAGTLSAALPLPSPSRRAQCTQIFLWTRLFPYLAYPEAWQGNKIKGLSWLTGLLRKP